MRFDAERFFALLVEHLRGRAEVVRSLAVMTAMERWVQFEAATLLDLRRADLGLSGPPVEDGHPRWWIACEYLKHDIWIALHDAGYGSAPTKGVSIELKAIHNNKNFDAKLKEIRWDLMPSRRVSPCPDSASVSRFGLVVATYVRYAKSCSARYQILQHQRQVVGSERYWKDLETGLCARRRLDATSPLQVLQQEAITSLAGAHYVDVDAAEESEVRLLLVHPAAVTPAPGRDDHRP